MTNVTGGASDDVAATREPFPEGGPRRIDNAGGPRRIDNAGGPRRIDNAGGRRRIDKGLLAASLVIAVGLVLVVRGLAVSITGDDRARLPELVESVDPVPESVQVLAQTRVYVDLVHGYTGVLVIDGTELPTVDVGDVARQFDAEPGSQIDLPPDTIYESGNATLTFTPNDDALISKFSSGEHRAQVIYWRVEEGRARARSFTWTFTIV